MSKQEMTRIERLFKTIEQAKQNKMKALLSSSAFVAKHFPYQDFAARKAVVRLSRIQDSLMIMATA